MKQLIVLSFSLCLMACHHQNDKVKDKKVTETNPSMVTKGRLNNNELMRPCVETEGDYETKDKCVHIENTCKASPNWCGRVSFRLTDKPTGKTLKLAGWDWTTKEAQERFKFYGYRAKDKDKVYEIDVRDDSDDLNQPGYYREWNKDMTKVLLEEKIINALD